MKNLTTLELTTQELATQLVEKAEWFHNDCCNMEGEVFRLVLDGNTFGSEKKALEYVGLGEFNKLVKKLQRSGEFHLLLDDELLHFTMLQKNWEQLLGKGFVESQLELV